VHEQRQLRRRARQAARGAGGGAAPALKGAARAGVRASVENPWAFVDTNMTGTLNMLELCRRLAVPKLILASTSSIYGSNAPLPTPETASSDGPLQPYSASKKGAEALTHSYELSASTCTCSGCSQTGSEG